MKPTSRFLVFVFAFLAPLFTRADDLAREQEHARNVTIIRDHFGVPHVYGRSDADTVFGLVYAQAEDDFNRVELNYVNASGRLAEIEGEKEIYRDLRMKLFIDPADMRAKYAESPAWLRALMDAFADGLNFYLRTHPAVKPKLLTRFEPWMALTFTEGSIGGDIETISLRELEKFYGAPTPSLVRADEPFAPPERQGSNGFAIAPAKSASGHALLLLNPHTSHYFRPEVHAISEEGLDAYGAVTWGQFFVYQGFSDRCGWMHTSYGGDAIDEYLETVTKRDDGGGDYKYGGGTRALTAKKIAVPFKRDGAMAEKTFTVYYSHHGPIVREAGGKWIAVRIMQEPIRALTESWQRTKAKNYAEFARTMELRADSSNNTVYADADGNIAYWHGNFIPRRDPRFDWTKPVDGSDPATEWQGLHEVKETITLFNPSSGYVANTNNWPFSSSGPSSPHEKDFPAYMWSRPENARGVNAARLLARANGLTLGGLIALAYDNYLSAFEQLMPALLQAYDATPAGDKLKVSLAEPVALLRAWDFRSGVGSVPATLAMLWGEDLMGRVNAAARTKEMPVFDFMATATTPAERLEALARVVERLSRDFGTWKVAWGEINRFQRLSGEVASVFDDAEPSLPIGFAPSVWGSLPAFSGAPGPRTRKKIYGTTGNSFEAVVEFGPRVKAKSILAGGESGDPASPHFRDQAERFAQTQFKDVLYYREDVEKNAERTYHPGG